MRIAVISRDMTKRTNKAITVATVKQAAKVVAQVGDKLVLSVCGALVATDGVSFFGASRRGVTNPVYTVYEHRLYPVRDVDGYSFVSIPA